MPTTEHTSRALGSWAGRVADMSDQDIQILAIKNPGLFRSFAASLLTQMRDRAGGAPARAAK